MIRPETLEIGMIPFMTVVREPDNKLGRSAENRPNYKGVERGVDEATTRKLYQKLAQIYPMKAGALHAVLADG
eukprot:9706034-Heterocapsa_arctica.AAC.1